MIPKAAIEKAIEGGWEPFKSVPIAEIDWSFQGQNLHGNIRPTKTGAFPRGFCSKPFSEIALDPSFWQCLGKALGWGKANPIAPDMPLWDWEGYATHFCSLILTGGDTEAFWKQLLG